jgi:uncharacterized protein
VANLGDIEATPPGPAEAGQVVELDAMDVESGPRRRCIVTREALPKEQMLRFVVDPAGSVVPDVGCVLPGRGLWLRADRDIVGQAVRKNLFARAARRTVTVPADLAGQVERLLARRCLDLLGLARRAGQAVAGFEPVQAWLAAGRVGVLLAASDGAADGRRKLRAAGRRPGGRDLDPVELFTGAELGAALGRDGAVAHVAVAQGRIADRLMVEARRLTGLRGVTAIDHSQGARPDGSAARGTAGSSG